MADSNDFWSSFSQWGPGLVQAGAGWYQNKEAQDEAKRRAGAINNDPNVAGLNAAQQAELGMVGNVDPAQLFAQQQGLMQPVKDKGQADLMRDLYKKGMLGLATDTQAASGTPGNTGPTWQNAPGTRSNPIAAAYFAAQAGADQRAAYDAIKNASDLRTAGISRVASLGGARSNAMQNAAAAQPARTQSGFSGMLSGITGLLGNKGVMDSLGGLFKSAGSNASAILGAAKPGYDDYRYEDISTPAFNMPQIGMDDMYSGGIFDQPSWNFDDFYSGGSWDSGWDLGGGYTWSGEYE